MPMLGPTRDTPVCWGAGVGCIGWGETGREREHRGVSLKKQAMVLKRMDKTDNNDEIEAWKTGKTLAINDEAWKKEKHLRSIYSTGVSNKIFLRTLFAKPEDGAHPRSKQCTTPTALVDHAQSRRFCTSTPGLRVRQKLPWPRSTAFLDRL